MLVSRAISELQKLLAWDGDSEVVEMLIVGENCDRLHVCPFRESQPTQAVETTGPVSVQQPRETEEALPSATNDTPAAAEPALTTGDDLPTP